MRKVAALLVVATLILGVAVLAAGSAAAKDQPQFLPTFEATYPGAVGSRIDSCYLCHLDLTSYQRNQYARDWDNAEEEGLVGSFRGIENLDSDGDGYTNLQEINAHTFPGNPLDNPDTVTTTTTLPGATTTSPPPGSGGDLFNQNCASCHGANGGNLVPTSLSRSQLITVISNGRGGMPAYSGKLSSNQIASIADFLLAAGSGTTTTTTPGATTTTTTPRSGAHVWSDTCSGCHGAASTLQSRNLTTTRVRTVITNGTTGMPAYGTTLSPTEIDNLVAYLATGTTTGSDVPALSGQEVYDQRCAGCHGSAGGNLAGRVLSLQEIRGAIESGAAGMPVLSLSSSEVDAVAAYVASLTSSSVTDTTGDLTQPPQGADLWVQFCSSCHGIHGAEFPDLTTEAARKAVLLGTGSMPGFAGVLEDTEVDALVSFVVETFGTNGGVTSTEPRLDTTSTTTGTTTTTREDALVFAQTSDEDGTGGAPPGLVIVVAAAMAGVLYAWFRAARHLFSAE